MNQVSVTACLTAYNASTFIQPVLASLAEQSWANLRILISDDGSDDGTDEIIRRFARDSHRDVEVHCQPRRLGWVDNTNFLLERVETELFFLCYHDDRIATHSVELLVNAIAGAPDAAGACGDVQLTQVNGDVVVRNITDDLYHPDPVWRGLTILGMRGFPWVANRGVFRREVLQTVGGLRKNLAGEFSAAFPWVLGLALEGRILRVPRTLTDKTLHASGVSTNWEKSYRSFLAMYVDIYETIWRSSLSEEAQKALLGACTQMCREIIEAGKMCPDKDLTAFLPQHAPEQTGP